MNFVPCVRWSGGKRKQSEEIIKSMPNKVSTVFIPFLGGGSVMYQLVNSNIKYDKIIVSDIYKPLMDIWDLIINNPQELIDKYTEYYNKFQEDNEFYYDIVNQYNKMDEDKKDPHVFHFITRSCMRGNINFDKFGNFITKHQQASAKGDGVIAPALLLPIVNRWSEALQDVELRCESYDAIENEVTENDYCFFDPPYIDGTWYKDNNLDMDKFYSFLRSIPCDYSITLNGDKDIYPIPEDLYTDHKYIYYGISNRSSSRVASRDSFWMRHSKLVYDPNINNVRQNTNGTGGTIPRNTDFKLITDIQNDIAGINKKLDKIMEVLLNEDSRTRS